MSWNQRHIERLDEELSKGHDLSQSPGDDSESEAMKEARRDVRNLTAALRLARLKEFKQHIDAHRSGQQGRATHTSAPAPAERSRSRRILLLAATAAVILLMFIFVINSPESGPAAGSRNQYLAEHFDAFIQHDVSRNSTTDGLTQEQLNAYNLFVLGRFDQALPVLEDLWITRDDPLAMYYLILCHAATGQTDEARTLFLQHQTLLSPEQQELIQRLF
ncbi:MAG: hypothetical protein R3301_10610 [Saprospiraceae bacterium]|nr:hypothetical protein [Saprospiraceae bacterium]